MPLESKIAPSHLAGICGGKFIQCITPEFRLYNILIANPLQHYHHTTIEFELLARRYWQDEGYGKILIALAEDSRHPIIPTRLTADA